MRQLVVMAAQAIAFALCSSILLLGVYFVAGERFEVLICLAAAPALFVALLLASLSGKAVERLLPGPSRDLPVELPKEESHRIVDVFARAYVAEEGRVIWSPPQLWSVEAAERQLTQSVKEDMTQRGMVMPSVIREQSRATVHVLRDEVCLRAFFHETFRVYNGGSERGAYFISNERIRKPNVLTPEQDLTPRLGGYSKGVEGQMFNWACTGIKIRLEGERTLEFHSTDREMYENLWHTKDYWSFDYPVVLAPQQSANIEVDMLIWAGIRELDSSDNTVWLRLISFYRNFEPKGKFEYTVIEKPEASVRVEDVLPSPLLEGCTREKQTTPEGTRLWLIVFPRIVMQRMGMGIRMFVQLA